MTDLIGAIPSPSHDPSGADGRDHVVRIGDGDVAVGASNGHIGPPAPAEPAESASADGAPQRAGLNRRQVGVLALTATGIGLAMWKGAMIGAAIGGAAGGVGAVGGVLLGAILGGLIGYGASEWQGRSAAEQTIDRLQNDAQITLKQAKQLKGLRDGALRSLYRVPDKALPLLREHADASDRETKERIRRQILIEAARNGFVAGRTLLEGKLWGRDKAERMIERLLYAGRITAAQADRLKGLSNDELGSLYRMPDKEVKVEPSKLQQEKEWRREQILYTAAWKGSDAAWALKEDMRTDPDSWANRKSMQSGPS